MILNCKEKNIPQIEKVVVNTPVPVVRLHLIYMNDAGYIISSYRITDSAWSIWNGVILRLTVIIPNITSDEEAYRILI